MRGIFFINLICFNASPLAPERLVLIEHKSGEDIMKMMLKWSIPLDMGQRALEDGSLGRTYKVLCNKFTPEAAYFYRENGRLAGTLIVDLTKASQVAEINQLLIADLYADVVLAPVTGVKDRQEVRPLEFA